MSECRRLEPRITPFIDGELAAAERQALEAHIRECPPCHSRVAAERTIRELIQARHKELRQPRAPAALRTRCAGGRRRDAPWRSRAVPLALAAGLVLLVGGAAIYQATARSAHVLVAELAADHVKCMALNGVVGLQRTGADVVEASMRSGFDWSVRLPQAAQVDLELIGARPCLYGEGRVAHIMYRHQGRLVSVFMLPKTARAAEIVDGLGYEAAIWSAGGRTFVVLAGEPRGEVQRIAAVVQTAFR